MFWAKTRPVSEASTDFGEIGPPIVFTSDIVRWSVGGPGGTWWNGDVVDVVVGTVAATLAAVPGRVSRGAADDEDRPRPRGPRPPTGSRRDGYAWSVPGGRAGASAMAPVSRRAGPRPDRHVRLRRPVAGPRGRSGRRRDGGGTRGGPGRPPSPRSGRRAAARRRRASGGRPPPAGTRASGRTGRWRTRGPRRHARARRAGRARGRPAGVPNNGWGSGSSTTRASTIRSRRFASTSRT